MNAHITLRDYQQECIDRIVQAERGKHLVQMATGLGKTVTFANIPRQGRMLILSHREELVNQPLKYFNCTTGIEMAKNHTNGTEEVVSGSIQTMVHRLDDFSPHDFDIIIVDEAHHAAALSYKKVIDHFEPRMLLGFTATPNRADSVKLNDVFDDIIFQRDLRWGIKHGYLCDIYCKGRYIAGCSWSMYHTPVKGWECSTEVVYNWGGKTITSYRVSKCPNFERG